MTLDSAIVYCSYSNITDAAIDSLIAINWELPVRNIPLRIAKQHSEVRCCGKEDETSATVSAVTESVGVSTNLLLIGKCMVSDSTAEHTVACELELSHAGPCHGISGQQAQHGTSEVAESLQQRRCRSFRFPGCLLFAQYLRHHLHARPPFMEDMHDSATSCTSVAYIHLACYLLERIGRQAVGSMHLLCLARLSC